MGGFDMAKACCCEPVELEQAGTAQGSSGPAYYRDNPGLTLGLP